MMITLLPGRTADTVLDTLRSLEKEARNLMSTRPGTLDRLTAYLRWVEETRWALRRLVHTDDVERLLPTHHCDRVLRSGPSLMADPSDTSGGVEIRGLVNTMVTSALEDHARAFDDTATSLEEQIKRWRRPGRLILLDTNVFAEYERELTHMDIAGMLDLGDQAIRVIVPMVVVDELDNGKWTWKGDKTSRARRALIAIEEAIRADGMLQPPGPSGPRRNPVTIELVEDPRGHVRLPIADDEILDRGLAVQYLANDRITVVTFDTGMALRARRLGMEVHKLVETNPPRQSTNSRK